MTAPKDYPVAEVLAEMNRLIAEGHDCFVKFTCAHCGARQTSEEPNTYHLGGYTCEACGQLTKPAGINFLLVMKVPAKGETPCTGANG